MRMRGKIYLCPLNKKKDWRNLVVLVDSFPF